MLLPAVSLRSEASRRQAGSWQKNKQVFKSETQVFKSETENYILLCGTQLALCSLF